jgi:hypothetical protein
MNKPDWTGTCESGNDPRKYTIEQQIEMLRSNRCRSVQGRGIREGDTTVFLNSADEPIGVWRNGKMIWSI